MSCPLDFRNTDMDREYVDEAGVLIAGSVVVDDGGGGNKDSGCRLGCKYHPSSPFRP